jgi:tetratricopeptide (TPR) repeat protein
MASRFESYTILEGFKLARLLRQVTRRYGHPEANIDAMCFSIEVLTEKAKDNPEDEFVWHVLADFYSKLDEHPKALAAAMEAYRIKPNHPRNPYAVATIYNTLASLAYLANHPRRDDTVTHLHQTGLTMTRIQRATFQLNELGLTTEKAAERAMHYFLETLNLRLSKQEEEQVMLPLNRLRQTFPRLNTKYNSTLNYGKAR